MMAIIVTPPPSPSSRELLRTYVQPPLGSWLPGILDMKLPHHLWAIVEMGCIVPGQIRWVSDPIDPVLQLLPSTASSRVQHLCHLIFLFIIDNNGRRGNNYLPW